MCIMGSLTVKNQKDVGTLVRSKTQKADDTNIAPQTRAGTALLTWAEDRPLPSLYMPKGARSCTSFSPTLTSQALPAMPKRGALPPDPPRSLNLAFRGSRVRIHAQHEHAWANQMLWQSSFSASSSAKKKQTHKQF